MLKKNFRLEKLKETYLSGMDITYLYNYLENKYYFPSNLLKKNGIEGGWMTYDICIRVRRDSAT